MPPIWPHTWRRYIRPAACREFVANHFSVNRMTDQYLEVYERALKGRVAVTASELQA